MEQNGIGITNQQAEMINLNYKSNLDVSALSLFQGNPESSDQKPDF